MKTIEMGLVARPGPRKGETFKEFKRTMSTEMDAAAEGGVRFCAVVDHLQNDQYEGLLSAIPYAQMLSIRYPSLLVGHTMLSIVYHTPSEIARNSATIHTISDGRFVLGVGAGNDRKEAIAHGYQFLPRDRRLESLRETLEIVQELWNGEKVIYQGTTTSMQGARLDLQRESFSRPPIMLGGGSEQILSLTAQYADWWNGDSLDPTTFRQRSAVLDQKCRDIDRNPKEVRRTWFGVAVCREDSNDAKITADKLGLDQDKNLVGSPEEIASKIKQFEGASLFIIRTPVPDLTTIQLMTHDVLPAVNGK
jgi:alkanesulfonate monooxygenase SsuD/methylene tetrahydromethanopterin reductase-like flavin-dependent oxidoreductase (luciferase family)